MCARRVSKLERPPGFPTPVCWKCIRSIHVSQRPRIIRAKHRTFHLRAAKRQASTQRTEWSTKDKGPRGLYDNWFRSSRLPSRGDDNALCGRCDEVRSQGSTCGDIARWCCLEIKKAIDVGGRDRERERGGGKENDRDK